MPPHLHPRSSATTTLFASTLAASFLVIGIPHIFPCPSSRRAILDSDGNAATVEGARRRRRSSDGGKGRRKGGLGEVEDGERVSTDVRPSRLERRVQHFLPQGSEKVVTEAGTTTMETDARPIASEVQVEKAKSRVREEEESSLFRGLEEEAAILEAQRRECPVPKPKGKIGELLGFGRDGTKRNAAGWRRREDE